MGKFPVWLVCALLASMAWGNYGVAARGAGSAFHHVGEHTFLMVCLTYAVLGMAIGGMPTVLKRDHGAWTPAAAKWGIGAGTCGALGALCVIWAIAAGGNSTAVMALVLGLAQLFNFLFSWALNGKFSRPANAFFWLSLPSLMACSWAVQQFRPGTNLANALRFEVGAWLLFTLGTAVCWGAYGVCARMAVARTKTADAAHGSHFQPLFWVSGTYAVFGIVTFIYLLAVGKQLPNSPLGVGLGITTGLAGLLGAALVIPANSVLGSPGPGKVMSIVFASAAAVNALCNGIVYPSKEATSPIFWCALAGLAVSALVMAQNNPTQPAVVRKLAAAA